MCNYAAALMVHNSDIYTGLLRQIIHVPVAVTGIVSDAGHAAYV
jgi:hypothetical protein